MAFIRYTLTGGLATAVQYALLIALVELAHLPADLSAVMSTSVGAVMVYVGNHQYTFRSRQAAHGRALPRFLVVATLSVVLNGLIVSAGIRLFDLHYMLAQMIATLGALCVSYRLNRSWTFA